jgi:hypothetical protein
MITGPIIPFSSTQGWLDNSAFRSGGQDPGDPLAAPSIQEEEALEGSASSRGANLCRARETMEMFSLNTFQLKPGSFVSELR